LEIPDVASSTVTSQERTSQIGSSKNLPVAAPGASEKPEKEISSLAKIAIEHDLLDFTFNSQNTQFAYYKGDHSLALRASSTIDIHSRAEKYRFEIDFSAEFLGLSAKDFEVNGGKPILLDLSFNRETIQAIHTRKASVQKTLRKPQDILNDLAQALHEVMKDEGNKSVSYVLDEEARQALMGDSKMLELLSELVMVMSMINLQKDRNSPSNDYSIRISGKGKPILNIEDHTQVEHQSQEVQFIITIHPPIDQATPEAKLPGSAGEA
jgi:hypothetical protein